MRICSSSLFHNFDYLLNCYIKEYKSTSENGLCINYEFFFKSKLGDFNDYALIDLLNKLKDFYHLKEIKNKLSNIIIVKL